MVNKHGVLKLVHAGGFVEIHRSPIRADEVMKKNPRHCVTRPDVFKFPWIVVRPESVLNIGSVFYIVPFHTLRRLMQRKKCPFENSPLLQQQFMDSSPVEIIFFRDLLKQSWPSTSLPRSKVDFKIDHWPDDAIFPECLIENKQCLDSCHDQDSRIKSEIKLELEEFNDSPRKAHSVSALEYENYKEPKQHNAKKFSMEPKPSFSLDIASKDAHKGKRSPKVDDGFESNSYQEQNKVLKSCLKKENNSRSRGFKVRFLIPEEDREKINIEVLQFQPRKSE